MKKVKYTILSLIILAGLVFLFGPEVAPENFQVQELLNSASKSDVIIIFNSGGWGDTPLEKAEDFAPIIEGIQETLNDWGYHSVVIPYNRTKDNLLGKIAGTKDFLHSFELSSKMLAEEVELLIEKFPDKKIVMAGLSNGGTFVIKTYEKISGEVKNSIYTIAVGTPFWAKSSMVDNFLLLENNGKDSLAKGDAQSLALTLIKTPFKWIFSKINGQNLTFSQAIQIPGHQYFWSSPEVSSPIITFLKDKIR